MDQAIPRLKRTFLVCLAAFCLLLGVIFFLFFQNISLSVGGIAWIAIPSTLFLATMFVLWVRMSGFSGHLQALEKQREDLKAQLYHAHKVVSVGQMAGEVVHEINNPLAIIDSQSGVIRDMLDPTLGLEASPEAIRKELDEIDTAVKRARGITHKILSFVRKSEPKLVESDVNQLLDDVVSGMKEKEFAVADIQVVKEYDRGVPKLLVDPDLMRQVFLNLLNNAGDAVGEGGTITLKIQDSGDCVRITVADTGPGMTPELLEKCFMPFFTTKKASKGTGLGLPICVNIIEGFGGKIEVASAPGKGTAFTLVVPKPGKTLSMSCNNADRS